MNHPTDQPNNQSNPSPSDRGGDVHAMSGAYAVDALTAEERAHFEAHLRGCADCRVEVDGLREAAALLGTDEAIAPPASVRDHVLEGIRAIRPLPPLAAEQTVPTSTGGGAIDLASRRRLRAARLPLLAAAAAVVLLAAIGGIWLQPWAGDDDAPPTSPRLTAAERVLGAEDASHVEKRFPDGAVATIVVSRSEGRAVILTKGMEHAPEGKDYQLWLQTPAGELEPDRVMPDLRDATVLLQGDASRATGVGITVEPDGGSTQPTSEPIAFFTLDT